MKKITKYLVPDGLASRQEYWAIMLICYLLITFFGSITSIFLFLPSFFIVQIIVGFFATILFLAIVYVMVVAAFRRCRDAGINSWFAMTLLVPTVNIFALVVFGILPTEKKDEL